MPVTEFETGFWNGTEDDWTLINRTFVDVKQTELRSDLRYVQYYILVTNFIVMGIIPSAVMIFLNVLVVRAVNEANQKRAKMTKRQKRNITVTSMLVCILPFYARIYIYHFIINTATLGWFS